jgi:hypothetical protein
MAANPNVEQQARVRFMTPVNVITVKDAVIANGASTSGIVDLDGGERQIVGLQMPAAWTTASLTFDGSHDGTTFVPIHHGAGAYTITAAQGAAASLGVSLAAEAFAPWAYVKIRSGVIGTYVNQGAERTIKVLTKAG